MSSTVVVPKFLLFIGILLFVSICLFVRHCRTSGKRVREDGGRILAYAKAIAGVKVAVLTYAVLFLLVAVLLIGQRAINGQASVDAADLRATGVAVFMLSTLLWTPLSAIGWGWQRGRSVGLAIENGYLVKFCCFVGCLAGVVSAAELVYLANWGLTSSFEDVATGYLAVCGILGLSSGLAGYSRGLVSKP